MEKAELVDLDFLNDLCELPSMSDVIENLCVNISYVVIFYVELVTVNTVLGVHGLIDIISHCDFILEARRNLGYSEIVIKRLEHLSKADKTYLKTVVRDLRGVLKDDINSYIPSRKIQNLTDADNVRLIVFVYSIQLLSLYLFGTGDTRIFQLKKDFLNVKEVIKRSKQGGIFVYRKPSYMSKILTRIRKIYTSILEKILKG